MGMTQETEGRKQNGSRLPFPWKPNVFLSAPRPSVNTRLWTSQPQLESPDWSRPGLLHPWELSNDE